MSTPNDFNINNAEVSASADFRAGDYIIKDAQQRRSILITVCIALMAVIAAVILLIKNQ